ncbi:hypothetical protein WMF37_39730 [Sorangium sp. So ce291]|uniref:hypothetical protein n=1 Tax=Sorangium sp. So ce291 TaxID=3133294 RepID=UPI003F641999
MSWLSQTRHGLLGLCLCLLGLCLCLLGLCLCLLGLCLCLLGPCFEALHHPFQPADQVCGAEQLGHAVEELEPVADDRQVETQHRRSMAPHLRHDALVARGIRPWQPAAMDLLPEPVVDEVLGDAQARVALTWETARGISTLMAMSRSELSASTSGKILSNAAAAWSGAAGLLGAGAFS